MRRRYVRAAIDDRVRTFFRRGSHHRSRREPHGPGAWRNDPRDGESADDAMNSVRSRGFTFVELIVSTAIMLAITASMFGFVNSARSAFATDLERADMQQRVRVAMDSLFRDLVMAGAGGQVPAVAPFRRGDTNADVPGAAFSDRVSVRYVPPNKTEGE